MDNYYQNTELQITPEYGNSGESYSPGLLSDYPSIGVAYKQYSANLSQESSDIAPLLEYQTGEFLEQGAIFKDVKSFLVEEKGNRVIVHELLYSRIVVLSQACDLRRNFCVRKDGDQNQDKILLTALVAPFFDLEKAKTGEHLSGFNMQMERLTSNKRSFVEKHDVARYYQFNLDEFVDGAKVGFDKSIVDFKHFFTVPISQLDESRYLTSLVEYHRERLSHRFSGYLSRIGIPE